MSTQHSFPGEDLPSTKHPPHQSSPQLQYHPHEFEMSYASFKSSPSPPANNQWNSGLSPNSTYNLQQRHLLINHHEKQTNSISSSHVLPESVSASGKQEEIGERDKEDNNVERENEKLEDFMTFLQVLEHTRQIYREKGMYDDFVENMWQTLDLKLNLLKKRRTDRFRQGKSESMDDKEIEITFVERSLQEMIKESNEEAMQQLEGGAIHTSLFLLTRGLEMIQSTYKYDSLIASSKCISSLLILCLNNMAFVYRRLGRLNSSLNCLHEACQISERIGLIDNVAVTHLNICAVQSKLKRHNLAIEHAQKAVYLAQEDLVCSSLYSVDNNSEEKMMDFDNLANVENGTAQNPNENYMEEYNNNNSNKKSSLHQKVTTLAVSYYNLAVELEHEHLSHLSLDWYERAIRAMECHTLHNTLLLKSFRRSYKIAKKRSTRRSKIRKTEENNEKRERVVEVQHMQEENKDKGIQRERERVKGERNYEECGRDKIELDAAASSKLTQKQQNARTRQFPTNPNTKLSNNNICNSEYNLNIRPASADDKNFKFASNNYQNTISRGKGEEEDSVLGNHIQAYHSGMESRRNIAVRPQSAHPSLFNSLRELEKNWGKPMEKKKSTLADRDEENFLPTFNSSESKVVNESLPSQADSLKIKGESSKLQDIIHASGDPSHCSPGANQRQNERNENEFSPNSRPNYSPESTTAITSTSAPASNENQNERLSFPVSSTLNSISSIEYIASRRIQAVARGYLMRLNKAKKDTKPHLSDSISNRKVAIESEKEKRKNMNENKNKKENKGKESMKLILEEKTKESIGGKFDELEGDNQRKEKILDTSKIIQVPFLDERKLDIDGKSFSAKFFCENNNNNGQKDEEGELKVKTMLQAVISTVKEGIILKATLPSPIMNQSTAVAEEEIQQACKYIEKFIIDNFCKSNNNNNDNNFNNNIKYRNSNTIINENQSDKRVDESLEKITKLHGEIVELAAIEIQRIYRGFSARLSSQRFLQKQKNIYKIAG